MESYNLGSKSSAYFLQGHDFRTFYTEPRGLLILAGVRSLSMTPKANNNRHQWLGKPQNEAKQKNLRLLTRQGPRWPPRAHRPAAVAVE